MKTLVILFALFIFGGANLFAQDKMALDTISSKDAKDYIGKTVVVKGLVADKFTSRSGNTFINFDDKSPNQTFTIAIFQESKIDATSISIGSWVLVSGEIKLYKERPEIVVSKNEQLISVNHSDDGKPAPESGK